MFGTFRQRCHVCVLNSPRQITLRFALSRTTNVDYLGFDSIFEQAYGLLGAANVEKE